MTSLTSEASLITALATAADFFEIEAIVLWETMLAMYIEDKTEFDPDTETAVPPACSPCSSSGISLSLGEEKLGLKRHCSGQSTSLSASLL